jgi:hypothetical protein
MKKIYFSVLSALTVLSVNAQLTQANHAPANGDTYEMYQCDVVSPGASGANAMWNFSSINTQSSTVFSYTAQSVSTATYAIATIGVASSASNTSYYKSTSGGLWYYGGNISVSGVSGSLNYTTAPAVYAAYPMSLNTTSSSATGGSINVTSPTTGSGAFTGMSTVLVDGSGTLTLPGANATFTNVLRVLTTQTISFNVLISVTVTQQTYEYFAPGIKAPLFSISSSTFTPSFGSPATQTLVTRNKNASTTSTTTVGMNEMHLNTPNFSIYPNPSTTSVNFVTDHPDASQVFIYDVTGKMVDKQILNDGKLKLDVSAYNKGLYLYTITNSNDQTLKSGKITVSQ